jgi:hypothetical protein
MKTGSWYCGMYTRCWAETSKQTRAAVTMQKADKQTAVSEKRLDKYFPAKTMFGLSLGKPLKITIKNCWMRCFLSSPPRGYTARTPGRLSDFTLGYSPGRNDASAGSWRISTIRRRSQRTADEIPVGWKNVSGCCGHLWNLEISHIAVIAYSSECFFYKWSINPFTNS